MAESKNRILQTIPDHALFGGELQGLVLICHENERPPAGLMGLIDWRVQGVISKSILSGAITGKAGECTYFPVTRHGQTYHLVLLGVGPSAAPGVRSPVAGEILKVLQKNLTSLKITKMGVSCKDFGDVAPEYFDKAIKGVALCIAP